MSAKARRDEDRQVIPRWRTFSKTLATGELAPLKAADAEDISAELNQLRGTFARNKNVYTAADLLNALVAADMHGAEAAEVAGYIETSDTAPRAVHGLSASTIHRRLGAFESSQSNGGPDSRTRASSARRSLQLRPLNAITWVDLALALATLGQAQKASRAMRAALHLSPDSRFVLRSAARMYVHLEDPEQAHSVLAQSNRLKYDPWILAAEMSTAQLAFGRFRFERAARELLTSNSFPSMAISELASELGSSEIIAGRDRRARLLFAQSLQSPTENAVAQAASMAEKGDLRINPEVLQVRGGFEARAISYSRIGRWREATEQAVEWHRDQPFAIEPVVFASYTASLGEQDFASGYSIAKEGLQTHPDDAMLNNNGAFALANLGRLDEAEALLRAARLTSLDADKDVIEATRGLIAFRRGDASAGRSAYEKATTNLRNSGKQDSLVMASLLWAIEEAQQREPGWVDVVGRAVGVAKTTTSAEQKTLLERLQTKLSMQPPKA